jgi:hypothetical protein
MTLYPTVVASGETWTGTANWMVTLRDTTGATASQSFPVTRPSQPPSTSLSIGDRIQTTSTIGLKVRTGHGLSYSIIATQPIGSWGTIIDGSSSTDGYIWWKIRYDNGYTGWSVQNWLQK